jgi:hypothetical protein
MPIAEPVADPIAESGNPAELSPSGPYRALKQGGLVLLCVAWIGLGLFGHDPWKPDDATSFGVTLEMLTHGRIARHFSTRWQPPRRRLLAGSCPCTMPHALRLPCVSL